MPAELVERVGLHAAEMGISHSEFLARAVARYINDLGMEPLTQQIDRALVDIHGVDGVIRDAVAAGRHVVGTIDDDW